MRKIFSFIIAFIITLLYSGSVEAQRTSDSQKDPCEWIKILLASSEPLAFSLSTIYKQPECFNGKLVRVVGIYRIAFENSDLYAPTGEGSSWLTFDPFYPVAKRCSSPDAWKLLDRKGGGTFGIVAMGIFNFGGRYGHLGGWGSQFQIICLEEGKEFSKPGTGFDAQSEKAKKQILAWYVKKAVR